MNYQLLLNCNKVHRAGGYTWLQCRAMNCTLPVLFFSHPIAHRPQCPYERYKKGGSSARVRIYEHPEIGEPQILHSSPTHKFTHSRVSTEQHTSCLDVRVHIASSSISVKFFKDNTMAAGHFPLITYKSHSSDTANNPFGPDEEDQELPYGAIHSVFRSTYAPLSVAVLHLNIMADFRLSGMATQPPVCCR
jgi:hypothetical protein